MGVCVVFCFFFQAEDDIRYLVRSRGLGDVYKRQGQKQREYVRAANAEGAQLIPHVGARPVTILMAFDGTVNPFMMHQNFAPLAALSHTERLQRLRDPAVRAAILAERVPKMGHDILDRLLCEFETMYVLEDQPFYEPRAEDSIAAQAARLGVNPAALAYDLSLIHISEPTRPS